ncbi:MAG TPA: ATP-dependent DNA helicase [Actinomycetota bacterium]|nr:ATP-dependent DNA helicase [Actinomycetota bacterium]
MPFDPDARQASVLAHGAGPLLVTGGPGTGKTAALAERFARLIEGGASAERVGLVVRSGSAKQRLRRSLLGRLKGSLPGMRVLTVHGLAYLTVSNRLEALGYERSPTVLDRSDQLAKVRELLEGEDPGDWPAYGPMLGLRGFADQIRQFVLRAQESLLPPEDILKKAETAGLTGWRELAAFYRRYLDVLAGLGTVDWAGLVAQAAASAGAGEPLFDHLLVDDYQDATFALERLLAELRPASLVVAGDPDAHVFSFQGTTDAPVRRFVDAFAGAGHVALQTAHRFAEDGPAIVAWSTTHTSEEHAAVARELRRVHVEESVPWGELAVVIRRQGSHLGGVLRALDDAGIPRTVPEQGLSLLAEPSTYPFVLAFRWLARPHERAGLVEPILVSDLAGLSPATARGLVRAALARDLPADAALALAELLPPDEADNLRRLAAALAEAGRVADRSALDAFRALWRAVPHAGRLVAAAERTAQGSREMDAVVAFSSAVARATEGAEPSVASFLEMLEARREAPGPSPSGDRSGDAVHVYTAHGAAGEEFDSVFVVGAVEGNFPSLSRPEPMFDLSVLDGTVSQSRRNRLRLDDERRLFRVVTGRARRRVVFTASDPHQEGSALTARSRFVAEAGVAWTPAPESPFPEPLSVAEAAGAWRRTLAARPAAAVMRLAALDGLFALGEDPREWWFQRDWTGTDRPLHESIRVSHSRLEVLENCHLQYVLAQELGLEGRAGYHAWVGHLVHRLIEDCETGDVERNLDAMIAAANDRWNQDRFPRFAISEAFRHLVTTVMLPAWFREYGETPALAREVHFEFEFDQATVSGYIDRIGAVQGGGSVITDYKTGKSRNATKAEDNLQLGIYYLAVNLAETLAAYRPVKGLELTFLRDVDWRSGAIDRRSKGFLDREQDPYREAMTARLTELIGDVRELLELESYRPDPGANCRFCDFKTLCPLFPEGKDVFPMALARQGVAR